MAKKKSSPIKKVESETEFCFHKNDVMSEEEDDVIFVSGPDSNARESTPPPTAKKGKKPPRTMAGYRQIVVEEPNHNTANDNEMIITQTFTLCEKECCEYSNHILGFPSNHCPCHQFETVPELDRVPVKYRKNLDDACMEFAKVLFEQNIINKQFDPNVTTTCNFDVVEPFIHNCNDSPTKPPTDPKLDNLGLTLKSLLDNNTDRSRIEETLKSLLLKNDSNGTLKNGFSLSDLLTHKEEKGNDLNLTIDSPKDSLSKSEVNSGSDSSSEDEPIFEEFSSFEVAVQKSDKVKRKLVTENSLEPVDFVLNLLQSKTKAFIAQKANGAQKVKSCPKSLRNRVLREKVEKYLIPIEKPDLIRVKTAEIKTATLESVTALAEVDPVEVKKPVKKVRKPKVKKGKTQRKSPVKIKPVEIEPDDLPAETPKPLAETSDLGSEKNEPEQSEKPDDFENKPVLSDSGRGSEPVTRSRRKVFKKSKKAKADGVKNRRKARITSDPESDVEVKTSRRSQPSRTLKNSINYYEPDDELVIDTDAEEDKNKTESTEIIDVVNFNESPNPSEEEEKENICYGVENISKNDEKNEGSGGKDCDEKINEESHEKLDYTEPILTVPLKGPKELVPFKESKIEELRHIEFKLPTKETIVPVVLEEPRLVIDEPESLEKHDDLENLSRDPRLRARRVSRDEEQKQRREKLNELEKKDEKVNGDEKLKIRKRKSVDTELLYKTPLSDLHGEETRNYNSVPSRAPVPNSRSRDAWNRDSTSWRENSRPRESRPKEPLRAKELSVARPQEPLLPRPKEPLLPRPKEPLLPRPKEPLLPTPWHPRRESLLPPPEDTREPSQQETPSTSRSVIVQDLSHQLNEQRTQLNSEFNSSDYPNNGVEWHERRTQSNEPWSFDNYRPPEVPSYSYNNYARSTSPLHQPDMYKMAYFQTNNITVNVNDTSQYQQVSSFQGSDFSQTSYFQRSTTFQAENQLDTVDQIIPKCDGPCPESPETMSIEDDERPDVAEDLDEMLRKDFGRKFGNGYRRENFRKDYRPERGNRPYQRRYDDRRDKYRPHKEFSRPHPRNTYDYNHRGKHNPNRNRSPDGRGPPIRRWQC